MRTLRVLVILVLLAFTMFPEIATAQEQKSSACPVAENESYGYSEDDPIRVGGGWRDGPTRAKVYLKSIRAPDGKSLDYQRIGSFAHGERLLDGYKVSFSGDTVTIYLDAYSYEELKAPQGFFCPEAIPLSSPYSFSPLPTRCT